MSDIRFYIKNLRVPTGIEYVPCTFETSPGVWTDGRINVRDLSDIGGGKAYPITAGATIAWATVALPVADTSIRISLTVFVKGTGYSRQWVLEVQRLTGEPSVIVSEIDDLRTGKTGALGVDLSLTHNADSLVIAIDGSALAAATTLDTQIRVVPVSADAAATYTLA